MSFENKDSDSVSNSESVTGPVVTDDVTGLVVVDDDWGKKLCGFCVGPETTPGGFPQAFGTERGGSVGYEAAGLFVCVGKAGNSSFAVFFGATVDVKTPGLLVDCVGSAGNSSLVVFLGDAVDVDCCWFGCWDLGGGGGGAGRCGASGKSEDCGLGGGVGDSGFKGC